MYGPGVGGRMVGWKIRKRVTDTSIVDDASCFAP